MTGYGGECICTPIKFNVETATIGPIIQGIGVSSRSNTYPAGIPTANALKTPGSRFQKLATHPLLFHRSRLVVSSSAIEHASQELGRLLIAINP
jgi:hypothetical protein